jgi:hypothetical protein
VPNVRVYDTGRTVRRVPISGIQVVEYDEEPGVYYTITGQVIGEDKNWAQQAGFDVVAGRKEKRRRELMLEAEEKIAEQVEKEAADIEARIAEEEAEREDSQGGPGEVHVQPGAELRAVHRGGGKYQVEDSQGGVLASKLSKKEADQFISDAAAAEEEDAASRG